MAIEIESGVSFVHFFLGCRKDIAHFLALKNINRKKVSRISVIFSSLVRVSFGKKEFLSKDGKR